MDENRIQLPAEPVVEEATKEVTEPIEPAAPQEGEAGDQSVEENKEENKGAGQRIKELNQRTKAAEAKAQSLADKLAELTNPVAATPAQPAYVPQVREGQEITPEQYQQDVTKVARAEVEIQIKQNNAINRINNESLDVVRKYPQLNPDSEQFDKELSETITEAVEAQVRVNPYSASVVKTVDKLMKHYQGAVQKEVGKVSEQVARQANETALRPNSIRQPEKPASEKTIAELEQELGTVIA